MRLSSAATPTRTSSKPGASTAVSAKMSADVGNAKPATEAVKGSPAAATGTKPARSAEMRVHRSELGR